MEDIHPYIAVRENGVGAASTGPVPLLPHDRIEQVYGWGMSVSATGYVWRPSTVSDLRAIFDTARRTGRSIGLRGAGRSYGDASLNAEGIVLDLTRLNRILDWNPHTGLITVEPGVTIRQLWQYILPDGWWPPVVPGTMFPTIGGCAAMNVHGKNNFAVGPTGDHIVEFDILLPSGEVRTCSRVSNSELFHAAIGGFGMLGCFTSLTLQMKRVYSGLLDVEAINVATLGDMFDVFEKRIPEADYLVGWIDAFAKGKALGRGVVHQANYLAPGVDPNPAQTLRIENQELPETILGLVPKSILWKFMRPITNNVGIRLLNTAKFMSSRILDGSGKRYRQSHAAFAFLLDYVPNWKKSYGMGGLIQYQSFVPKETARDAFAEILRLGHKHGHPSYLAVFKRHRPDDFLMTHALDGYSLALDFKMTRANREEIRKLTSDMDRAVIEAGGKFYFAKDSTLSHDVALKAYGEERIRSFLRLKQQCDPDGILETNLFRRLFGAVR